MWRLLVDADDRQDMEANFAQARDESGVDQRGFAGAGGRVEQNDALSDEQVEQILQLVIAAVEGLTGFEGAWANVGIGAWIDQVSWLSLMPGELANEYPAL